MSKASGGKQPCEDAVHGSEWQCRRQNNEIDDLINSHHPGGRAVARSEHWRDGRGSTGANDTMAATQKRNFADTANHDGVQQSWTSSSDGICTEWREETQGKYQEERPQLDEHSQEQKPDAFRPRPGVQHLAGPKEGDRRVANMCTEHWAS